MHRDLKPANIFLTELPGDGFHVKLLDFGIGKRIGTPQGLTGENDVMGTPDYMPPEQALGKTAHVDQRGDQYSLAVIVYEMLAGRNPVEGDMMAILEQVIGSQRAAYRVVRAGFAERRGPRVAARDGQEPSERFESIVDFASALASAASQPPTTTPTPSSNTTLRLTSDQP